MLIAALGTALLAVSLQNPSPQVADTSRPGIPPTGPFPADSTIVVAPPGDSVTLFYRNLLGIRFDDSTSGPTIRSLFKRYQAEIIGGLSNAREYIVRLPDPGSTYASFESLTKEINSRAGVMYAAPIAHRSGYGINTESSIKIVSDTTRPAIPPTGPFPYDLALVVSPPGDTVTLFFRNLLGIHFDDATSGSTIRQIFARHDLEIVGGLTNAREYIVRFADPGPAYAAFDSVRNAIKAEPGVRYAAPMLRRSGYGINARFPEEGLIDALSDTAPPAVPDSLLALPDTLVTFYYPDDPDDVYFRNVFFLLFDDSTSGTTINAVLQRYQAEIIGGSPSPWDRGAYIVRVPDPGASMQAVDSLNASIETEPGVRSARPHAYRGKLIIRSQYPNNGTSGQRRSFSRWTPQPRRDT